MSIVRWDPFRNITTLQDRINRLFDDAFPRSGEGEDDLASAWRPKVDIFETNEGIVIQVDLPGVEKDKVSVEVKANLLTIQGERIDEMTVPDDKYYRRERATGFFSRSFTLRESIAPDKINASFKNGVLKIELPNPEENRPKQVTVNIE